MSILVELALLEVLNDFDQLILKCELLHLPEVSKRLQPIRDVIAQGLELRRLVQGARSTEADEGDRVRTTDVAKTPAPEENGS